MENSSLKKHLSALAAGTLFGLGLAVSQMINPEKVIGFLSITDNWDPSLILVMGAAFFVALLGFKVVMGKDTPIFEDKFYLPTSSDIDKPLLTGAALFGIGWGLAGYCPGPVIASLALLNFDAATATLSGGLLNNGEPLIFLLAMVVGSWAQSKLMSK